MKVLFLTPISPVPADFGGALRVYHVLRQLSLRHEVTVLGYGDAAQAAQLKAEMPRLQAVQLLRPTWKARHRRAGQLYSTLSSHSFFQLSVVGRRMQRALDGLLARGDFDVVHTEFSHFGPFRMNTRALKVLDTHNVEYDNFKRMWEVTRAPVRKAHYRLEYQKMRRDELALCRSQHAVLATSDRDARMFGEDVKDVPRFVVPNGVDMAYFAPSDLPVEPHSLVFTGMMAYVPNYDGVGWFLDDVLPLIERKVPDVKLYVVGKSPPDFLKARASERVVVTGSVPDVRPYAYRSAVSVVPLRMGGGTRLKIAEALAMKKPVVTTAIGCEGLEVKHGESALIADTPQAFADAVVSLLEDPAARQRMGEAGHALARARYDWGVVGERLEDIYRSLKPGAARAARAAS